MSNKKKGNTYQCFKCKGIFTNDSDWTHEKKMKEYKKNHDEHQWQSRSVAVLCDDCYEVYLKWKQDYEKTLN